MQKKSIRKEIDKIKESAAVVLSNGNIKPETELLIKHMLSIIQTMAVFLLEKKTRKSSSNSALHPSLQFAANRNKSQPEAKKDMGSFVESSKLK